MASPVSMSLHRLRSKHRLNSCPRHLIRLSPTSYYYRQDYRNHFCRRIQLFLLPAPMFFSFALQYLINLLCGAKIFKRYLLYKYAYSMVCRAINFGGKFLHIPRFPFFNQHSTIYILHPVISPLPSFPIVSFYTCPPLLLYSK